MNISLLEQVALGCLLSASVGLSLLQWICLARPASQTVLLKGGMNKFLQISLAIGCFNR